MVEHETGEERSLVGNAEEEERDENAYAPLQSGLFVIHRHCSRFDPFGEGRTRLFGGIAHRMSQFWYIV